MLEAAVPVPAVTADFQCVACQALGEQMVSALDV